MGLPGWVQKHKTKGIAIEKRGDSYYATRVTSVWDPDLKRARKKTLEYLGKVTPEGIVPPKHKREAEVTTLLAAGHIRLIEHFSRGLVKTLKKHYSGVWDTLITLAALRLAYGSRLKNMRLDYQTSVARRVWPEAHVSKNALTDLLEGLGRYHEDMRAFFQDLCEDDGSYMAIDLSHVFSDSINIPWLERGHNGQRVWHDQLTLVLLWSLSHHRPGYLRLLPGSIPSAPTIKQTLVESGLKNVVLVADKGFYSKPNVEALEAQDVDYVLAVPRDKLGVPYPPASAYKMPNYFLHGKRVQWFIEKKLEGGRRLILFLDKRIQASEENALLRRVDRKEATMKQHKADRKAIGTLAVLTNTSLTPPQVHDLYRDRNGIETAFDTLANTLEGDKTYMQSPESFRGYYFILFLSLYIWSQIRDHLKRKGLLAKYSVQDVLKQLGKAHEVVIDGKPSTAPVPKQVRDLVEALELPITKIVGS